MNKKVLIALIVVFVVLTILFTYLSITFLQLRECQATNEPNARECGSGTMPNISSTGCVAKLTCGKKTIADLTTRECILDSAYTPPPLTPSSDSSTGTIIGIVLLVVFIAALFALVAARGRKKSQIFYADNYADEKAASMFDSSRSSTGSSYRSALEDLSSRSSIGSASSYETAQELSFRRSEPAQNLNNAYGPMGSTLKAEHRLREDLLKLLSENKSGQTSQSDITSTSSSLADLFNEIDLTVADQSVPDFLNSSLPRQEKRDMIPVAKPTAALPDSLERTRLLT